ncbi:phage tail assembly protein [Crossiella sp. SN42]|uniref:phage tail assembly protein n=1 Tax=Crossiella sp. SN42 TaxID=2944808 RepID=UPI00207CA96D|nr:phage tail assembly protein [Crossiella sp. SN42]MCO1575366.1 phage tail assembly protein [Crossiella sp. SN42]
MRAQLDRRFANFSITCPSGEVILRAVIRLPKHQRDRVEALLTSLDDGNPGTNEALEVMRQVLAESADHPERLLTMLDGEEDSDALTTVLFQEWAERTQPGEASRSAT